MPPWAARSPADSGQQPKCLAPSNDPSRASSAARPRGPQGGITVAKPQKRKYWSQEVTRNSNALDLEPGVFKLNTPRAIAASLQRSALASSRRKGTPLQSAMSMLNFYINRAGRNLPVSRQRILQAAKPELRRQFGRAA
ncbi:MAG: DUF3175 domain-containing protein [Acidobacteria bacterium]|nr:MAG: DUF3175 domain-containing protein [Acidobacteriota bacterium]